MFSSVVAAAFVYKCNNTAERVVCRGTLCLVSVAIRWRRTEMPLKSTTFLTNALKSVWVFYVVIFTACTVFCAVSLAIPTSIVSYKWSFRTLLKSNCHCCLNKLITMCDYLVLVSTSRRLKFQKLNWKCNVCKEYKIRPQSTSRVN